MNILFLLLLLMASRTFGEGPIFQHKQTFEQQEFENVYQDLRGKLNAIPVRTKSQLATDVPVHSNLLFVCSDCTTDVLVISTGSTSGSFSRVTSRTTAIQ